MALHVLITRGAGYLGSVLCEHLVAAGYQVTVVDNLTYGHRDFGPEKGSGASFL